MAAVGLSILAVAASAGIGRAQQAATPAQREQKHLVTLRSDAPLFEKARACQQLAVVGTAKSVPVLAGLLGDERLGGYARFAMEPIDDPSVDAAFREAVGKLSGRLLAGVINSIAVRRDAKAVAALKKLAGKPSSPVAAEALAALGQIATDEAVAALRGALTEGAAELRVPAADACMAAAERLLAQKKQKEAIALYDAVRAADVPGHVKAAGAYHAIVVRGPAGAALLIEHLRSGDASLRGIALRAARALPGREVTEALAAEVGKAKAGRQVLLIQVLAERKGPGVRKAIAALAGSGNAEVRVESLKALGRVGDASSVAVLLRAAGGSGEEAAVACASLRRLGGDGTDAAILSGMKRAAGGFRVELIGVLADRNVTAATAALLAEAGSDDPAVAKAAFKALGVLASPKEIPAMLELLLVTKSGPVVAEAENAIVQVAAAADPARRAEAALASLASARQPAARASLLRVLGRIGGAKAYDAVAAAVGDADAVVKDAAVRALAAWSDARAAPTLLKLAKDAGSKTHRILALRGYVRLLGLAAGRGDDGIVRKYAEAMALADAADAKKLVLAGLAGVAHVDALKLAADQLGDRAVRAEAASAAVTIARAVMGADREAARSAMEKVIAAAKAGRSAVEARKILQQIDRFADSITAWRVAGPYMQEGKIYSQLFDIAFEPEKPGAKGVVWRPLAAGTDPKRPAILDLKKALGGDQRAAYVLTWVHSASGGPARLELGSDDGVKAWLNGQLVHANNVARAAIPYTDKADITLKAGWNPLLMKITQNQIPWEFCARLCARDGSKLAGIRIDAAHEGDWTLPAAGAGVKGETGAAGGRSAAPRGRLPNIVFILADDLGYGDVGCYNPQAKAPTPHLDRLARQGVRFTDAHSPSTVCTPTRYSILTGRMAFRTGMGGVFTGVGGPCMIEKGRLTLPQMLREKGYTTGGFGKWHVGMTFFDKQGKAINKSGLEPVKRVDYSRRIPDAPIHRGFDRFFGTVCCPTTDWLYAFVDGDRIPVPPTGILDRTPLPKHPYSRDNRPGMIAPGFDLEEVDMVFLDKSLKFLEGQAKSAPDKPFFLYHSTQAVHLPSFAGRAFRGKTKAGPHGDFIFEFDHIVGELMKALDRLGFADNTLLIVSSDNGPEVTSVVHMRKDHKHDGARPWRGVKRDQWEGGHRVPFIARWPGKIKPASTSDQTICLTDVMATCAAVVGAKLPQNAAEDSYDVLPALLGQKADTPVRRYTLHQTIRLAMAIRRGPWKYLDHKGSGGNNYSRGRMKPYALPDTAPDAPGQLYNLQDDPGETTNLYYKHPEIVKELKEKLEQFKTTGRSAPNRAAGT